MRTLRSNVGPRVAVLALVVWLAAMHDPVYAQALVSAAAQVSGQTNVAAQPAAGSYTVPVTGEPMGFEASGIFYGNLQITRFDTDGSTLLLRAVLNENDYRYEEGGKSTIGNIRRDLALLVTDIAGGCEGVAVVLEPLNLGGEFPPEIMLGPIVLEERGQTGKQVEKLLCTVGQLAARPNAPAHALANLLNQVLRGLSS